MSASLFPSFARPGAIALAVAVLVPAGAVLAQDPVSPATPADPAVFTAGRDPIAKETTLLGGAGLWAAGPSYKVSLHDGFTFYPYVGGALEHQPVHWRTTSVTVGGAELLTGAVPTPRAGEFVCDYDLGALVERYELRDDGVEQTFVIAKAPGVGDLVIDGALTTPLHLGTRTWQHAPLDLTLADGRAVVRYGAATAIDANGKHLPMDTACDGATVRLRLSAAALASAAFPLVVDPLLSNVLLDNGVVVADVDLLHETLSPAGSLARTWVAYTLEVAANDHDLWVKRFGTGFSGTATPTHRELTLDDAAHPRLALAPGAGMVVTVYASGPTGAAAQRAVYVHRHDVNDFTLALARLVPWPTAGDSDWRPDVGGRLDSGDRVIVVWQRDAGIPFSNTANSAVFAGLYDASINAAIGVEVVLRNRPARDQERPSINRSARTADWLVAYQEHDGTVVNDDWDIVFSGVNGFGPAAVTGLDVVQSGDGTQHKITPVIAGTDGRYLLLYTLEQFVLGNPKPQNALGEQVFAQRLDYDATTGSGTLPWAEVQLAGATAPVLGTSGLAFDDISGSHWCATRHNNANGNYVVQKLGYRGAVVETSVVSVPTGFAAEPGGVAFATEPRQFALGFGANDGSANGNRVYGAVMAYDAVPPPSTYAIGCGAGTWSNLGAMVDRQQVGAQGLTFSLANAPERGIGILVVSLAGIDQPLDLLGLTGCRLLVDMNLPNVLDMPLVQVNGGAARVTYDLPEDLPPLRVFAQWGYPATGANPANFQVSEGLDLQLGR